MKCGIKIIVSIIYYLTFSLHNQLHAYDYPVFIEPPAPQQLAEILYKPRYRSLQADAADQTNAFGMMVNFVYDSTRILADSMPLLDSVGEMLKLEKVKNQVLVIEGHTDARGTELYNNNLSLRRAKAIKLYLIASFDIQPQRLVIIGQGESQLYDYDDPQGALNRRAVFRPQTNLVVE